MLMSDEKNEQNLENDLDTNNQVKGPLDKKLSRRNFIQGTGLAVGGVIIGGGIGGLLGANLGNKKAPTTTTEPPANAHHLPTETKNYSEALQFFTRTEDFDCLTAATEVIYPEDENGPGAIKLGAPFYIDKQLASLWGRNADDYMKRPFTNGHTPLTRSEIMLQGVRKINEVSQLKHETTFNSLKEDEQITILQEFESGKVEMELVSSVAFFGLLRSLTLEGCFCDPLHGGNKNMEGWKMKEWPGAQMSYIDVADAKDFVKKDPISLSDHM